ncbi:MAG TPA: M17 family peptidase N-terminal domain-containing protein [Gemmataceae bacterium]|jgi:hypothetical protein
MKCNRFLPMAVLIALMGLAASARPEDEKEVVKEKALDAPHKVQIKVRMEGPYTADVPLQVICYFKYTPEGAKKIKGAPVELDKRLDGVIASLRERGEFVGTPLETLLITPPKEAIKAKALLLVGLGNEDALSLKRMEAVGRVSLREAARLGVNRVAFAPLIRDQGNAKFGTGDVATAVVRGMLLAYDTEKRLQKEGLGKDFTLEQWNVEAGPAFFEDTVKGVQKGIEEARATDAKRPSGPYGNRNK